MTDSLASRVRSFVDAAGRCAWDDLASLTANDGFRSVGPDKTERDWAGSLEAIGRWAGSGGTVELRRVDVSGDLAFAETDIGHAGTTREMMVVFAFDEAGRIRRIDAFG